MDNILLLLISLVMVGAATYEQEESRVVAVQDTSTPGEAIEFQLQGSKQDDAITWLVLAPSDIALRTFNHGTSFIVDPPNDYIGVIKVTCIVVDFDNRMTVNLMGSTMVDENSAPASEPGDHEGLAEQSNVLQLPTAPFYSGEVFGAWNKASSNLRRLRADGKLDMTAYETVVSELIDDLAKAPDNQKWKAFFDGSFKAMENKPISRTPEMFLQVADAIASRRDK